MAGFAAKIFLANKAFILLQKTAIVTFAKRIIPLLVSTKGKLVAAKLATAGLAGTMRALKTALPFAAIVIGIDAIVSSLIKANVAQRDLNNILEFGTEKQIKNRIEVQKSTRALLENTIATLKNKAAKAAEDKTPTALEIEMGITTGPKENPFLMQIKAAEAELKTVDKTLVDLSKKLFELSADRRISEAERKAEIEALLRDISNAGGNIQTTTPEDDRAKQLKSLGQSIILKRREAILATNINETQRAELETLFEKQDIKRAYPQLTEEELAPLIKILETELGIKLQNIEKNKLKKEGAALLAEQEKQYKQIADTIQNGIVNGIYEAIEGSKSLAASFSGILKQLGKIFLARGIGSFKNQDGTGGSGLLGMFANGGRPPVGRPSIVGERGPELFVPDRAGTIIPNHQLGGSTSVVVNVDASGTEVQGNQGNADQLGRLIGQAVQAELIKQKRPGGLLTR
jgi:hypothetical protein